MEENETWRSRNPLLILTIALLAATVALALPSLHVEIPGVEHERAAPLCGREDTR